MADAGPTHHGMVGQGSMALAMNGAIAAGLALAIGADAALGVLALVVAVLAELAVFFVAHAYVDVVGERYDHPEYGLFERISHGGRHAAVLLLGGLPALVVFGVERLAGIDDDGSATGAMVGLVLLLGGFGYVAARRVQSSRGRAVGEGLVVALIGVGILTLKLQLK
ncbi:MAG: hypothetical protein ABJA74_17035 [Lapillicoccus sp.]